jgi:ribonuclease D
MGDTASEEPAVTSRRAFAVHVGRGDLPARLASRYRLAGRIAWDVETTGLDWRRDRLGTCQLYAPDVGASLISMTNAKPVQLLQLLEDGAVRKVFHHAPFDLRFLIRTWHARPEAIRCTKVASKLLDPDASHEEHTLRQLTWRHLGVRIEKGGVRTSDWSARELNRDQVDYAVGDVLYLLPLLEALEQALGAAGLTELYENCCAFLPAHALLTVGGFPDVFAY